MTSTDSKILAIRKSAGNDCATCPTCTRAASNPYRRVLGGGKVVEGCIDASHSPHLEGIVSSSGVWHFRAEAIGLRKAELSRLTQYVKETP